MFVKIFKTIILLLLSNFNFFFYFNISIPNSLKTRMKKQFAETLKKNI